MPKATRRMFEPTLEPLIQAMGLEWVIRKIGVERLIERLGVKRIYSALTPRQRQQLKRLLDEGGTPSGSA